MEEQVSRKKPATKKLFCDYATILLAQYVCDGGEHSVLGEQMGSAGSIGVLYRESREIETVELSVDLVTRASDGGRAYDGFHPTALVLPHDADEMRVEEIMAAAAETLVTVFQWANEGHTAIVPVEVTAGT